MSKQFLIVAAFCCVIALPLAPGQQPVAKVPRVPPQQPAQAIKSFVVHPGFHVELLAAEPLLMSPVALDIDENGRVFVAEFPEYNAFANKKPQGRGRIVVLEDPAGDGRYDRRTVYADNIDFAVAVGCWDGGVYVGAPPDLLYLKDTHGDGKADIRRVVYTGFGRDAGSEGMMNSFRWGMDNRLHISTGLDGGYIRSPKNPTAKAVSVRGQGFLLELRSEAFTLTGGGAQHGMCLDDWGRTFVCENSDAYGLIIYDSRYLARNPHLEAPSAAINIAPGEKPIAVKRISKGEPWREMKAILRKFPASPDYFTGASGMTVYRGDAYPAEYRGDLFVGDVAYNVVQRARVVPKGISLTATPADKDAEFLASRDNWFRPVQFHNAPDGCLWVIDMYRELIEGAAFVPPEILRHLDVGSGVDRGRLYRIAPDGYKHRPAPLLGKASTKELVGLLEHANGWHRDTAMRLLYQRQDRQAAAPLEKLASASRSPLARALALHSLEGLRALQAGHVLHGLHDANARVREHAIRLAEGFLSDPAVRRRILDMIDDPDALVRYQLAFSLGNLPGTAPAQALARLARRDGADSWVAFAILSSSRDCAGELFAQLSVDRTFRVTDHGRKLLGSLADQVGASERAGDLAVVLKQIAGLGTVDKALARFLAVQLVDKQRDLAGKLPGADGARVKSILQDVIAEAKAVVGNDNKKSDERIAAVRALALAPFAEARPILAGLLDSRHPPDVQTAAVTTLARFTDINAATTLLAAWRAFSPSVRATAIEALCARRPWVSLFLDAVAKGEVARADIDPARVEMLKAYPDPAVRSRAGRLFAQASLARRADVVAAYAKALQIKGDPARGKMLFKTHCSVCHRLEGVGQAVGADLTSIRSRGMEAVMLNILDPNREVQPQYQVYVLETTAGRLITGMIVADTATSLTLHRVDGMRETVLRSQIAELRSTGLSLMPEGLEKQIDVPAMADILAYLNEVK